jgi:hypothetical protein
MDKRPTGRNAELGLSARLPSPKGTRRAAASEVLCSGVISIRIFPALVTNIQSKHSLDSMYIAEYVAFSLLPP